MKSSFCIDLQRFMLIPTKFPLSPIWVYLGLFAIISYPVSYPYIHTFFALHPINHIVIVMNQIILLRF